MPDDPLSYETEDYNWGGDGSDLEQPVRAHVEAALLKTSAAYLPPLDKLLTLGSAHDRPVPDPASLGITQAHVPELVRMARDRALHTAPEGSSRSWAPIWALQLLPSFDVSAHIDELIRLYDLDSEWFGEELANVFQPIGELALGPLVAYIQDQSRWIYGRGYAVGALQMLATGDPALSERVVQALSSTLADAARNDEYINSCLISELLVLHAVESLPTIRQAFEMRCVNESITGDWLEVLAELDVEPDPEDPLVIAARANPRPRGILGQLPAEASLSSSGGASKKSSAKKKKKDKRKMAKASRKANKKRR